MRKWILLGMLVTGILFPFERLASVSSPAAWFLQWAFDTNLSHVVMHSALFSALGLAIMETVARPGWQSVVLALAVVAGAALGQEAFQAISAENLRLGDTLFDLGVDLVGGGMGIALARAMLARRRTDWETCPARLPIE